MSDLHIPNSAWDAAGDAVESFYRDHGVRPQGRGAIALIVHSTASLIVAAELRRLAARLCTNDARELEKRAFELDGGAS